MSRIAYREVVAILGGDRALSLLLGYAFLLGPALVVGSSPLRNASSIATIQWCAGAFVLSLAGSMALARFAALARDLRLPGTRSAVTRSAACLLGAIVAIPTLLFRAFLPMAYGLVLFASCASLGYLVAMTWRKQKTVKHMQQYAASDALAYLGFTPGQVMRCYIGSPFRPLAASAKGNWLRLLLLALWCLAFVFLLNGGAGSRGAIVPLYLVVSGIAGWTWQVAGLASFIHTRSASFAELALLPGLGDGRSQRRAICSAALAGPMAFYAVVLSFGLLWSWSQGLPRSHLLLQALGSVLLLLWGGAVIIQQLFGKPAGQTMTSILIPLLASPLSLAPFLLLSLPEMPWSSGGWIAVAMYFAVAGVAITPIPIFLVQLRALAKRAHPFLDEAR